MEAGARHIFYRAFFRRSDRRDLEDTVRQPYHTLRAVSVARRAGGGVFWEQDIGWFMLRYRE